MQTSNAKPVLVLGIETSCDETGVAVYDRERGLLAHALYSQIQLHAEYGGVVPELASRAVVGVGDVVVALASGAAGALAFTTGVSAVLIGVMVAVALLPPLVAFGLLLGGGHAALAAGALSLFAMNLICVNLAGVATFLLQGIRPVTWWEEKRAARATRIAIGLWVTMLAALAGMVLLLQRS